MNTLQILKVVRQKIFEPRKKIIFNAEGNKIFSSLQNFEDTNKNNYLNESDLKTLEEGDGWNLADKEYVDLKISELYKFVKTMSVTVPTAPLQSEIYSSPVCKPSSNIQKTIFVSNGVMEDENMVFFSPGLVVKKNWNITDFTLFFNNGIEEELFLTVNNLLENKLTQISKIKTGGKQIFSADAKYKVDSSKVILFQIKMPLKSNVKASIQITIEI